MEICVCVFHNLGKFVFHLKKNKTDCSGCKWGKGGGGGGGV